MNATVRAGFPGVAKPARTIRAFLRDRDVELHGHAVGDHVENG